MNATDVNLYLVGFMGTGKSTVGRAVAHRLGFQALDSDHAIEGQQGKAIPEIFAEEGEPAFRLMERAFIERGAQATPSPAPCQSRKLSVCVSATHDAPRSPAAGRRIRRRRI